MKILEAGTQIVCPGCGDYIGVFLEDIAEGDTLNVESVQFARNQEKMYCDKMCCTRCEIDYYDPRSKKIHTSEGWK